MLNYNIPIELEPYSIQKLLWPTIGNSIVANFDESHIILYQAYSSSIAKPLLEYQNFVTSNPDFNPSRMTWFKPNFLWMMYRSDWAQSKNQENILAFRVNLQWFESCLLMAKLSGKDKNCRSGNVVIQWDPHHGPNGNKVSKRRCIQIGIRKDKALEWAQGTNGPAIVEVIDMTQLVRQEFIAKNETGDFLMPKERLFDFEASNIELFHA